MAENSLGETLLLDPNALFRQWNIIDIYMGPGSDGTIVPNVNDMVVDWTSGIYRVISVATTAVGSATSPTYIPSLRYFDLNSRGTDATLLRALTRYQPSIMERAFLDPLSTPRTLTFDDRYVVYGSENNEYKVFFGTDTSESGEVISTRLNSSGDVVSENFRLENIDDNPAEKRPMVTTIGRNLLNGEVVTLVTYNALGGPTGEHPFIVKHGNAIRNSESSSRYIDDITLISDAIDPDEPDLLHVVAGTSTFSHDYRARVSYSDGTSALVNVDGTKVILHGLDNFNTLNVGVITYITLTYYASVNEAIINVQNPTTRSISRTYRLQPIASSSASSIGLKLFVSPKYNSTTRSYDLNYYLLNLAHTILIKVADGLVTARTDGAAINTAISSGTKVINLTLNISDVIPNGYTGVVLSQTVTITFGGIGNSDSPWVLDYSNDRTGLYGNGRRLAYSNVLAGGGYPISPTTGLATIPLWKEALYNTLGPLYDPDVSLSYDDPTHFYLMYEDVQSPPIEITLWESLHNNILNHAWTVNDTVNIVWIRYDSGSGDQLTLGVSPLMIANTL